MHAVCSSKFSPVPSSYAVLCVAQACCLVFDTETSHLNGYVVNLGWILGDATGKELISYDKLWKLPPREKIHPKVSRTGAHTTHPAPRATCHQACGGRALHVH